MSAARRSFVLGVAMLAGGVSSAKAAGVQVQFMGAATAPAGAVVAGAQTWICDASQGFAPFPLTPGAGVHLPVSPTAVPATCGQIAADGNGNVYITQGIVDTTVTPSPARGILRATLDPQTGALIGSPAYIATTVGLGGDQPTAAAIGPDGNLYIAFLKNGNIKRIVNPAIGTTQVVQSVGSTPSGHPGRSLAFVGTDLYVGSVDAFSVIHDAVSSACQGGCNAATIADGFPGVPHVGVTSNGVDTVYFAVGTYNQVWRYTPQTQLFSFVASGFSFVASKSNLLALDQTGMLWIGDDPSGGTAVGAGRVWTATSAALAAITGGASTAGTNLLAILNTLHGPWLTLVGNTSFIPTFNTDGTFTATIQPSGGAITTTAGTWTLTPPLVLSAFANPQGHLRLVDAQGIVLLEGDVLLVTVDQLAMMPAFTTLIDVPSIALLPITKFAA